MVVQCSVVLKVLNITAILLPINAQKCSTVNCTDGQVRLMDGDTDVEGRVEICFGRRWGTISGDEWTQTESTVVCNDLGYEPTAGTK